MDHHLSISRRLSILVLLILSGELIFFLPFVFARVFRPTLLEVYQISNLDLGYYFSVYGLVAMASYFAGGPLADKFSSRNLISLALASTALGGFVLALFPNKELLVWIYGYWGFTTIFLFWAALIKATRMWGGESFQGKAFGFLEGGRGATAALVATGALLIFSDASSVAGDSSNSIARIESYKKIMLLSSGLIVVCALIVRFIIPADKLIEKRAREILDFRKLLTLSKLPEIWLLAIIIICAYSGYKITDIFSLYANEILNYNEYEAAGFGTFILWMRPVFAVLAGFIADRFGTGKVIHYLFILMLLGSLLMLFEPQSSLYYLSILNLVLTVSGVYGIRAIYFAMIHESNIPLNATGAAVGLVSFLGFTPDVFMSLITGFLLDNNPGFMGFRLVFLLLSVLSILGASASYILWKRTNQVKLD
jgi:MFS family permease